MVELDGVANVDNLGGDIYDFVVEVVVEGRSNTEPITGAEVPCLACSGFVVDGNFAFDGAERCGVIVDGTIVVFLH